MCPLVHCVPLVWKRANAYVWCAIVSLSWWYAYNNMEELLVCLFFRCISLGLFECTPGSFAGKHNATGSSVSHMWYRDIPHIKLGIPHSRCIETKADASKLGTQWSWFSFGKISFELWLLFQLNTKFTFVMFVISWVKTLCPVKKSALMSHPPHPRLIQLLWAAWQRCITTAAVNQWNVQKQMVPLLILPWSRIVHIPFYLWMHLIHPQIMNKVCDCNYFHRLLNHLTYTPQ